VGPGLQGRGRAMKEIVVSGIINEGAGPPFVVLNSISGDYSPFVFAL